MWYIGRTSDQTGIASYRAAFAESKADVHMCFSSKWELLISMTRWCGRMGLQGILLWDMWGERGRLGTVGGHWSRNQKDRWPHHPSLGLGSRLECKMRRLDLTGGFSFMTLKLRGFRGGPELRVAEQVGLFVSFPPAQLQFKQSHSASVLCIGFLSKILRKILPLKFFLKKVYH